ncbi:hypothetical protein [Streptomyces sp. NPDC088727]|uniref:hypothetical protein n=1 Tax=Streptomyces sp. NPDC088727 TaxID=3365875 RepID=UPI00381E680D
MSAPIGGSTRGLWIEPGEVHKAAEAARKVAHDIPEDIKALFTPTDTAVVGLVGFQSAQAIDDCLEAWTKALRSLAGMVGSAAGAVSGSGKSLSMMPGDIAIMHRDRAARAQGYADRIGDAWNVFVEAGFGCAEDSEMTYPPGTPGQPGGSKKEELTPREHSDFWSSGDPRRK